MWVLHGQRIRGSRVVKDIQESSRSFNRRKGGSERVEDREGDNESLNEEEVAEQQLAKECLAVICHC
jgi:hypothetical protein